MKKRAFISALIVGAGAGKRFDRKLPKQFVKLAGKPVTVHSLEKFEQVKRVSEIIVVVPEEFVEYFQTRIAKKYRVKKMSRIIEGGPTRQESVYRGLLVLDKRSEYVLVQDAVRPLVTEKEIEKLIDAVLKSKAAILAGPVTDTVKEAEAGKIVRTHPRDRFWLAQTPQAFETELLKRAYEKARKDHFQGADCSSLVERLGKKVALVEGSRFNLKITEKEDLILAEKLLNARRNRLWQNK